MGDILEWAKREVEIACKKENPNRKEGEFDYGCACYESALKAFESLTEDGHSGFSIKMTQTILNRLIDGKPLTPIEDTDDAWNIVLISNDDKLDIYQCKRMSALFKYVYEDGLIRYSSNDCCYCVDINNPKNTYSSGMVRKIIEKMFPITMPYMPGESIKVYCEDFLTDERNIEFDTFGVLYALKEENGEQKRIEINRFFREPFENEESEEFTRYVEISKEEYEDRKSKKIERRFNYEEL